MTDLIYRVLFAFLGRFLSYVMLVYEAKCLPTSEKNLILSFNGDPNYLMTKNKETDILIQKGIAAMSTNNRAMFTEKGMKIKNIITRFNL